MRHLDFSQKSVSSASITVANDDNRFAGFGDEYRDKNTVALSYSTMGDRWALKLKPSWVADPDDDEQYRLDESYLAGTLGNWVMSVGLQDRWWAPGWDTNLALSSNARPMPALALTRRDSHPFRLPFTDDYQIPWTVTTFMADMGTNRTVANTPAVGFPAQLQTASAPGSRRHPPGAMGRRWPAQRPRYLLGRADRPRQLRQCRAGLRRRRQRRTRQPAGRLRPAAVPAGRRA